MQPKDKQHLHFHSRPGSPVGVVAIGAFIGLLVYMFGWSANFQEPKQKGEMLLGGDYLVFFVPGQMIRHGHHDRLYDFEFTKRFQRDPTVIPYEWDPHAFTVYPYPPFFVWLCLPFSYLSFHAGAIVWAVMMAGLFVGALMLMLRSVPGGMRWFGWALLGCLAYHPLILSIYTCQNATLSLLILAACYALLRGGRPFASGAVFALLAFKPQLTIVIGLAMLCTRHWRFVGGAAVGGLMLLAASLAVSPSACLDYIRLAPTMSKWIDMPGMHLERMSCWYGFWRLAFAGQSLWYAQAATIVMSIATLVPLVYILRRPIDPRSPYFAVQYGALVLATVVLSPHLLTYDLTLLLLPVFLLATFRSQDALDVSSRLPRSLALALFVAASVSWPVASATGVQIIVPLVTIALAALAKARTALLGVPEPGIDPPPQIVRSSPLPLGRGTTYRC